MLRTAQSDRWDDEIKGRERLFVLHYCTNTETFLNATQSYKAAYEKRDPKTGKLIKLDQKSCESAASRLMKKDRVRTAVTRLLKTAQVDLDEKATYQLLHDLMIYATYNTADIINEQGELRVKKLSDLGELAKCVTDIIPTKYGLHIKLADRSKYIAQLLNYLDLVRPELKIDAQLPVIEMVQKSINMDAWNEYAAASEKQ